MLGQPNYMLMPKVVGFKLHGRLREGVNATDLVLRVTEILRKKGVVEKFVEFCGPGLSEMSLPDRATIANMAPEYGATVGFFPVDDETLRYLRLTGRTDEEVDRVERYTKEQGLFRTDSTPEPEFSEKLELDLASVEPNLAGPKRPQDRVALSSMKTEFRKALVAPTKERGFGLCADELERAVALRFNGHRVSLGHGAVVIAAITSCTNTSNPSVMLGAGLVAKKALEGTKSSALRQNQSRARLESGHGIFAGRRDCWDSLVPVCISTWWAMVVPRASAIADRCHPRGGECSDGRPIGGGGSSFRQSQFRGSSASAGSGKLSCFPAIGRSVRAGRHG